MQIKIDDVNEFVPRFEQLQYTVEVPEDVKPGKHLLTVHATDDDYSERNNLLYRIVGGTLLIQHHRSIDQVTDLHF